jgi:hypothetical protein
MVELVDEADLLAPRLGPRALIETRHILAIDADCAFETAFEQTDRLKHRRLARSRRTEQRDDLAALQRRIDAAQHVDGNVALCKAALQVDELQDDITHSAAPARDRYSRP